MKKITLLAFGLLTLFGFSFGLTVKVYALTENEILTQIENLTYSEKIERMYINGRGATSFYYTNDPNLNSYGEDLYNQLYDFVKNNHYEDAFVVSEGPLDEYLGQIGFAYQAFVKDHVEFFWLTGGYSSNYKYTENALGERTTTEITLVPLLSASYVGNETKLINDIDRYIIQVELLVEESKSFTYNYEKVKFFHDWLVLNNQYSDESLDLSHSPVGALLEGYFPVCEAYAEAFMVLCNYVGIHNIVATGDAGERHAWNYVRILDEWYFTDVTWDDPITSPHDPTYLSHVYFLTLIDNEHTLDENQVVPTPLATSRFDVETAGNFYIVNFFNEKDEIYFTNEVKEGNKSLEPSIFPAKDGFKFTNWDQDFTTVNSNLDIKAVFSKAQIIVKDEEGEIIPLVYETIESILSIDVTVPTNYLFIGWSDGNKYYTPYDIITTDLTIEPIIKKVVFTIKGMTKIDNEHFSIPLFNIENIVIEVEDGIIVKNIEKPAINSFTSEYDMEITFGSDYSNSTVVQTVNVTATGMGTIINVINWLKVNYIYILVGFGGIIVLGIIGNIIKRKKK